MSFLPPPTQVLDVAITGVALVGIGLPVLGLLAAAVPYVIAVLVALVRRDGGGPFVPHTQVVRARTWLIFCVLLGAIALLFVQPRFFRASTPPAHAAGVADEELRRLIQPLVASLVDSSECAGLVVGVSDASGRRVLGFGRSALHRNALPDGGTVFEIGPLTQVFTATLLVRLAERGVVRMDQSVQSLVPDSVSVPLYQDQTIQLRHLATWSSGLPRLEPDPALVFFTGMFPPLAGVASDYSTDWLYGVVSSIEITEPPGRRVDDSDIGMGLLGHVLQKAARADYETLVRREVCEPLGMKDTRVTLTDGMRGRMAQGVRLGRGSYRGWRVASPYGRWKGGELVGAGGLCSTANDLLTFLDAHLGRAPGPLDRTLAETRQPRYRVPGRDVATGWYVAPSTTSGPVLWQHGTRGGSRSWMAMREDLGLGVVVLASSPIDVDRLGAAILKQLTTRPT